MPENRSPTAISTLTVDSPTTADTKLYSAVYATRSPVVPFEPSRKGTESVNGLTELVEGMEEQLNITVGVLAVAPMGFSDTNSQQRALAELRETDFTFPVTIRKRGSLFEGC